MNSVNPHRRVDMKRIPGISLKFFFLLIMIGLVWPLSTPAAEYDPWAWSKKNLDPGWME